jgi:hypothetical protein
MVFPLSLSLSLSLSFLSALIFNSSAFAEDYITITTYYPSPYGVYNKLQSNKLAVGDTNDDSEMTSSDQPPANGQIYTARSVIYKPQSSLPATDLLKGEVAYNNSDNKLYSYDGSAWAAVGGSSGNGVTMLSAESSGTYSHTNAATYCRNLSAAAAVSLTGDTTTVYTDWLLPSVPELAVFEGATTSTRCLWTGTVYEAAYSNYSWILLGLGDSSWTYNAYNASNPVRCVR